jgi:hypothetical protein
VYKAVPRDEYFGREDVCTGPLGVIGLGGDAERGSSRSRDALLPMLAEIARANHLLAQLVREPRRRPAGFGNSASELSLGSA